MKLVILSRHSPDNIEVKLKNSVGRAAQQWNQEGKHSAVNQMASNTAET